MSRKEPPPESTCRICSKAIRPGTATETEHGEVVHTRCLSRQAELQALEAVDRAKALQQRAERLFTMASLKVWGPLRTAAGMCPLCGEPTTVMDWRPRADWIVIEECPCDGFFVWTELAAGRLPRLSPDARRALALGVRECRARGDEVWLATTDGTLNGPLVIRTARPRNL